MYNFVVWLVADSFVPIHTRSNIINGVSFEMYFVFFARAVFFIRPTYLLFIYFHTPLNKLYRSESSGRHNEFKKKPKYLRINCFDISYMYNNVFFRHRGILHVARCFIKLIRTFYSLMFWANSGYKV